MILFFGVELAVLVFAACLGGLLGEILCVGEPGVVAVRYVWKASILITTSNMLFIRVYSSSRLSMSPFLSLAISAYMLSGGPRSCTSLMTSFGKKPCALSLVADLKYVMPSSVTSTHFGMKLPD